MRRFLVRLTAVAALTFTILFVYGVLVEAQADSPDLDSLATQLVGSPVTVVCFPHTDDGLYAGYVYLDQPTVIYMDGARCGSLQNVLRPGPRTARWLRSYEGSTDVGYAFLTLSHEATHLRLLRESGAAVARDEGLTECVAIRNTWSNLKLLGLPWKVRSLVYKGALYDHNSKPTTGPDAAYRKVC